MREDFGHKADTTQTKASGPAMMKLGGTWLTPREAATLMRVSIDRIYAACQSGDLKHWRGGRRTIRIQIDDLRDWVQRRFVG
jgi:excisionase family DNA binding protein